MCGRLGELTMNHLISNIKHYEHNMLLRYFTNLTNPHGRDHKPYPRNRVECTLPTTLLRHCTGATYETIKLNVLSSCKISKFSFYELVCAVRQIDAAIHCGHCDYYLSTFYRHNFYGFIRPIIIS